MTKSNDKKTISEAIARQRSILRDADNLIYDHMTQIKIQRKIANEADRMLCALRKVQQK